MKIPFRTFLTASLLSLLPGGCASSPGHELQWLSGCWQSSDAKTLECWDILPDGRLSGSSVTQLEDGREFRELLKIEREGPHFVYVAQPGDAAPTRFAERARDQNKIVFENPEHDYPQVITYVSDGDAYLMAEISDVERTRTRIWEYDRVFVIPSD